MGKRDPRVDAHIAKAPDFAKPIPGFVREAVHGASSELDETITWQSPTFTDEGQIVCGMTAFKAHARRVATIFEWVSTGKPRNWKYMK
ncbi:MAG TPA: DUF1801 domain-containing protein [Vicinamibacterales bacterium]|jgi:hypothetical protein|nr:DUF1801 domain-containing protein [Vicinamibacterales bacterium]